MMQVEKTKQIELKNYKPGSLVGRILVLSLGGIFIGNLTVSILLERWGDPKERLLLLGLVICAVTLYALPVFYLLHNSKERILITEDGLTHFSGKKVLCSVKNKDIIAYGCYSHIEADDPGFIFFCFATFPEITATAKKCWHWRTRLYRKNQLEELEQTPVGMWKLQMSVFLACQGYTFRRSRNTISINHTSKEELHAIWDLWKKEPMLLGAMALCFPFRHL